MRSFSKKLASILAAAAMVVTLFPAAKALAADDFTLNRTEQTLYVNNGVNDKGVVGGGLYGNVQMYDFNLKNKPSNWKNYGYKWTSSNEKVATVVSGGITTAKGVGTATISCEITDKATGKVVTTLKAKVTVKANAKEVIISNAATYEDSVVEVGDVVDLNRTLVDENGNKSGSRGKYVTDLTKWVAEPSTGVEINQSNGQYTFTEAAAPGEYKLYCYTYQSNKYNQPTATSEAVIVTLENNTDFEIKQTVADEFRVVFNGAVDALKKEDVTVELIDAVNSNFKVPCLIESVTLADDKKSATVKLYTQFTDAAMYKVTVKDVDHTFVASNGLPVDVKMSINQYNPDDVIVPAGTAYKLYVSFYDAAGVLLKMGSNAPMVYLSTDQYDKCILSYEGTDNTILFTEAGVTATVSATCNGYIGNTEINIKKDFTFYSRIADPVVVKVTDKELQNKGKLSTPFNDSDMLVIKVNFSDQASWVKETIENTYQRDANGNIQYDGNGPIIVEQALDKVYGGGRYMFKLVSLNPDVATVNADMSVSKFIVPTGNDLAAGFILKAVTKDANGAWTVETPIDIITIQITKSRSLNSVTLDKTLVSVGNTGTSGEQVINLTVKDQYNDNYTGWGWPPVLKIIGAKFECLDNNELAKAALGKDANGDPDYTTGEIRLVVDGNKNSGMGQIVVTCGENLQAVLKNMQDEAVAKKQQKPTSVQLRYRLTITSSDYVSKSVIFSVRVQDIDQVEDSKTVALAIVGGSVSGDVGRYVNQWYAPDGATKAAKTCTIEAFQMKDGLRLRKQDVELYPADTTQITENTYYVQLMKNNQDITNSWNKAGYISVSGSVVTLKFSQLESIKDNTYEGGYPVSGSALYGAKKVTYDLGAGNIAVYLWQAVTQNGKLVLTRVSSAAPIMGTTKVDIGNYKGYTRLTETINSSSIDQASVRACFDVFDRNGNNVAWTGTTKYVVDYQEADNYVFVKCIRFYEDLGNNEYAEYVVDINQSLKKVN